MSSSEECFKIFRLLEKPAEDYSPRFLAKQLDRLRRINNEQKNVYASLSSYVRLRLSKNVHADQLMNIRTHLSKDADLDFLCQYIDRVIILSAVYDSENLDHFHYMYRRDSDGLFRDQFIDELSFKPIDQVLSIVKMVSKDSHIDKIELLLKVIEHVHTMRSVGISCMPQGLGYHEQIALIIKSLETDSNLFGCMLNDTATEPLCHVIENDFLLNGDSNMLSIALRQNSFSMITLSKCRPFIDFITKNAEYIPKTIDHLFNRSVQNNLPYFSISLGVLKNKKKLLEMIIPFNDDNLINSFFSLYKNDPEVEHLTLFI